MQPEEQIIIASDVSVVGKASAWACYIKTDSDEIKLARLFKKRTTSGQGELQAMINAIAVADKLYDIEDKDLIIYCDCASVLTVPVRKDTGEPRKRGQKKHAFIEEHLTPYLSKAKSHKVIWLPGHRTADTPADIRTMHKWCDKNSRLIARAGNK